MDSDGAFVEIVYRNHRGETFARRVCPIAVWFGSTEWHAEEQWLLRAFDEDRQAERNFALSDVILWGNKHSRHPMADLDDHPQVSPGTYRHFKGGLYRVHGVVWHSENEEPYVLYTKLQDGGVWVRSVEMFLENVEVDGVAVIRFERTGD